MDMVKEYDLLSNIKKINPKNDLLLMSYKFNLDFFETHLLPRFINNCFPLILIDYNEYQNNMIKFGESKFIEKKYFIDSVDLKNVHRKFHPKLMLSLGKKELKLWIGSNNLTTEGYTDNAEIIIPININLEKLENYGLIKGICDFIESLESMVQSNYHLDRLKIILKSISNKISKKSGIENDKHWIIHNIKEPLLKQILEIIDEPIQKIEVIAPYFAQSEGFYQEISNICDSVHIIIQQFRNNLPINILRSFSNFTYSLLNIPNNRFLHAKILFFKTKSWNYILAGSANFTKSALTTKNNIELVVLIKNKIESSELISILGKLKEVKLDEIKIEEIKPLEIISTEYSFRILSSCFLGLNKLKIEVDEDLTGESITLYLNDIKKDYKYEKHGRILKFEIPENEINTFLNNNYVRIEVNSKDNIIKSDYRLIYNPILFPVKFKLLNTININDPNWLIEIILKLVSLPERKDYLPVIKNLEEKGVFTHPNKEKNILENKKKMLSSKISHPNYTLENLIDDLIKNKINKISRAVNTAKISNPYEIIDTFILSNKLILGAAIIIVNKFQSKISKIRVNFNNFLVSHPNYFYQLSNSEQKRLVKQSKLKYHALITAYITTQLQLTEIKKKPNDKYENVKERFDLTSTLFIQKLINIENNLIEKDILHELIREYSVLMERIIKIPTKKFLFEFNGFMQNTYQNPHLKTYFEKMKLSLLTLIDQ